MIGRRARVRLIWTSAALLLLTGGWKMFTMPLTTRQGLNFEVSTYPIPAYVKAIDFLQRHFHYDLLVSRICESTTSATECTLAIFDWTHKNILPTPEGWTIVDNHVTTIIIRGHGTSDQRADVFVTLTGYAGIPAVFKWLTHPQGDAGLVLAFARLDDKWVMVDVQRNLVFRDRIGQLADVHQLVADPALVDDQAGGIMIKSHTYSSFITSDMLLPFTVPSLLRAEWQQPWPRFRYELRRAIGLERD